LTDLEGPQYRRPPTAVLGDPVRARLAVRLRRLRPHFRICEMRLTELGTAN
jgi:hypothetical protein